VGDVASVSRGRPAGGEGSRAVRRRDGGQTLLLSSFPLLLFPFSSLIDRRQLILAVPSDSGRSAYRSAAGPVCTGRYGVLPLSKENLDFIIIYKKKFIVGMLTNFGSMTLDRIHNTLKMFCVAEPSYDKSLQQLQSFLSGLISEEKLEIREGLYVLKK
ncbi:hypothetical protein BHM03_00033141, partial [Ensete ventricosum]